MSQAVPVAGSFRDPSGFLFTQNERLFRQVNLAYQEQLTHLETSGLLAKLVKQQQLIPHERVADSYFQTPDAFAVIEPQRVPFISYPYEWSFSQLKAAALLTLDIQSTALAHGMTLKDASAYNVQFLGSRPVFIDTLSFDLYTDGDPWVAYKQFCQQFLAPLLLMSYVDERLQALSQVHIDGIPLDLTAKLLPKRVKLRPAVFTHIVLHAKAQQQYSDQTESPKATRAKVSQMGLRGLLDSLSSTIKALDWKHPESEWGNYYSATNYDDEAMTAKVELVERLLTPYKDADLIIDAGANTGRFSTVAAKFAKSTVSLDIDPVAVDKHFIERRNSDSTNVLPLVMDFTSPSPSIGWGTTERPSIFERSTADVVMALALVHHLAISNNVPLPRVAAFFQQLGTDLLIEFVPKEDSQVRRLLATRTDIFPQYTQEGFEQAFTQFYQIIDKEPVPGTERTLYLLRPKD